MNQNFSTFLKETDDLVCIIKSDGFFLEINSAWQRLLGWNLAELSGQKIFNLIGAEDRKNMTRCLHEMLLYPNQIFQFNSTLSTKKADYLHFQWKMLYSAEDKCFQGIAKNIDSEINVEKKFTQNLDKDLLINILEHTPSLIYSKNTEGQICFLNKNSDFIFDLPKEVLIGTIASNSISDWSLEKNDLLVMNSKENLTSEKTVYYKNSIKHFQSSRFPLFDENGELKGFGGIFTDITEQKKIETEIKNLYFAIDSAAIVSVADMNGNFLFVNDAFVDFSKYKKSELVGKNHLMLVKDLQEVDLFQKIQISLNSGEIWRGQLCNFNKSGELYYTESVILPFKDSDDKIQKIITISFDITQRKIAEKNLEDQNKLLSHKSKMASLGEMAAGIAHEINNPLAIITGRLGLLIKHLDQSELNVGKIKDDLFLIEKTSQRIAKIVKGLKTISRSSDSDSKIDVLLFDLISDTLILCVDKFKKENVDIRISIPKDVSIFCHNVQISQILLNLLNNSLDAIEHNENKWISITHAEVSGFHQIAVTDCGLGIPKEVVEKMMTAFFTTKPTGIGTGLGLSVSNDIAVAHGGKLFYNYESKNTQFVLEIPSVNLIQKVS